MNRDAIRKSFENMGSRVSIRTGRSNIFNSNGDNFIRINVSNDKKGEHFTITIDPRLDENEINIQVLDVDKKLRQMLLLVSYMTPMVEEKVYIAHKLVSRPIKPRKIVERLLVGHDEMHWFVAGVTSSTTIAQAFERLRPSAVTKAVHEVGLKKKDRYRRKTKGFIRQGEWFFVPVHFEENNKTIIHKNEPIQRRGGSPHIVEELIRIGGKRVWVYGNSILAFTEFQNLMRTNSSQSKLYSQRVENAKVLARGKVKHRDHHTIELKGWHEVHLSNEVGASSNAFID